jgi:hypothetical protein
MMSNYEAKILGDRREGFIEVWRMIDRQRRDP